MRVCGKLGIDLSEYSSSFARNGMMGHNPLEVSVLHQLRSGTRHLVHQQVASFGMLYKVFIVGGVAG